MKNINIVRFETAKALKEAGFPQTAPEVGQVWNHPHGEAYFIQYLEGEFAVLLPIGRRANGWTTNLNGWVFAPTAMDILRELAKLGSKIVGHEFLDNPAEAAANAFLNIKSL